LDNWGPHKCYALVPELQPFGDLESSHIGWLANLVHKIPVALLGKVVLYSNGEGVTVLTRVPFFSHDAALELRLQILVNAPPDVVKKLCDRTAVVVEDVRMESLIE